MNHQKTLILIADASKARIFSALKARFLSNGNGAEMELLGHYTHDDSRKKGVDLVSDKVGNFGPAKLAGFTDPKVIEAEKFAIELVKLLLQHQHLLNIPAKSSQDLIKSLTTHF